MTIGFVRTIRNRSKVFNYRMTKAELVRYNRKSHIDEYLLFPSLFRHEYSLTNLHQQCFMLPLHSVLQARYILSAWRAYKDWQQILWELTWKRILHYPAQTHHFLQPASFRIIVSHSNSSSLIVINMYICKILDNVSSMLCIDILESFPFNFRRISELGELFFYPINTYLTFLFNISELNRHSRLEIRGISHCRNDHRRETIKYNCCRFQLMFDSNEDSTQLKRVKSDVFIEEISHLTLIPGKE